jgi:hypothetical protein
VIEAATWEDIQRFKLAVSYTPSADCKGIKIHEGGEIQGIVLYDYWTENAVQMHVWIPDPRCLSGRVFFREAFRYPFELGNRGLAIAVTPAHNTASLRLQKFLGFVEKYRIQDGWAIGEDMVISELKRENCVWLRPLPNVHSNESDAPSDGASAH